METSSGRLSFGTAFPSMATFQHVFVNLEKDVFQVCVQNSHDILDSECYKTKLEELVLKYNANQNQKL